VCNQVNDAVLALGDTLGIKHYLDQTFSGPAVLNKIVGVIH
jgi:hypothetical protein